MWENWNCLSLFTSHVVSTSRAEHSTSYRGRATTSFRSYHQLKTCYLKTINLNLGRRCGQTEIVCLFFVTSHVVGTSRAKHTTSYMSCKQMKTLSLFTTRQSKSWKKVWPLFFLSLITSHAVSTTQGRAYNFLYVLISRRRLCRSSPQDNQSKSQEKMWPLVGVYDTWEQFFAGVHKAGNMF